MIIKLYPWIHSVVMSFEVMLCVMIFEGVQLKKVKEKNISLSLIFMLTFFILSEKVIANAMPALSSVMNVFIGIALIYVLFNRLFNNSYLVSSIKTLVYLLMNLMSSIVYLPVVILLFNYFDYEFSNALMEILGSIWMIGFYYILFYFLRNKINTLISYFMDRPKLILWEVLLTIFYAFTSAYIFRHYFISIYHKAVFLIISFSVYIFIAYRLYCCHDLNAKIGEVVENEEG